MHRSDQNLCSRLDPLITEITELWNPFSILPVAGFKGTSRQEESWKGKGKEEKEEESGLGGKG